MKRSIALIALCLSALLLAGCMGLHKQHEIKPVGDARASGAMHGVS